MKINIVGDIYGNPTGFNCHTRRFAKAFVEKGYDVGITTNAIQGYEYYSEDWLLNCVKKDYRKEVTIYIGNPIFNYKYLTNKPVAFIQMCVWEGKFVPRYWKKSLENKAAAQIWVPSIHVRDALINTFNNETINNKVRIVPEGVDRSIYYKRNRED